MNTGRWGHSAVGVNKKEYVFGGYGSPATAVEDHNPLSHNPLSDYLAPKAEMPTGIIYPKAFEIDGKIYVPVHRTGQKKRQLVLTARINGYG